MTVTRRLLPLAAALVALLAVAGSAAAAQTVDISADNAKANASFQKLYEISVACPDTATIGTPFTCTYSNAAGTTADVAYVIKQAGKDRVAVSDAQETKAIEQVIPLSYWIGISVDSWRKEKVLKGATLDCPTTATSPSERVTCAITAKKGSASQEVQMRFKHVKPLGWALVPVSTKKFAAAILLVT